jgi:hypothetical protein
MRPSSDDAHDVAFFRRHDDNDNRQAVPGREFLNACPIKVRATMRAVLTQVDAKDRLKPLLVVICGLDKPFRTELSDADYRQVRTLGDEYLRQNPRSLA